MKTTFCAAWLIALWPHSALSEPDSFFVGDSHLGSVSLSSANPGEDTFVINPSARVTEATASGATTLSYGTVIGVNTNAGDPDNDFNTTRGGTLFAFKGFSVGDLVIIWQWAVPPGTFTLGSDQTAIDLDALDAAGVGLGRFELARIGALDILAHYMTFAAPLIRAFPADVTQVVKVPEFASFDVNSRFVTPPDFDVANGAGSLLAVLVQGVLKASSGRLLAYTTQFPTVAAQAPSTACSVATYNSLSPIYGARSLGVTFSMTESAVYGTGALGNGGGGGFCDSMAGAGGAGGGGGGGFGAGGRGGGSQNLAGPGGYAGRQFTISPANAASVLMLGGPGGEGQGQDDWPAFPNGFGGGGAVFARIGGQLSSSLDAEGASGHAETQIATAGENGASAAGTVHVRYAGSGNSTAILAVQGGSADPGFPGDNTVSGGGGGGGGGGLLFYHGNFDPDSVLTSGQWCDGGLGGSSTTGKAGANGGPCFVAHPFSAAFRSLPTPSLNPVAATTSLPTLSGVAEPGASIVFFNNGLPFATPVTSADGSGEYSVTLTTPLVSGTYAFTARMTESGLFSTPSLVRAATFEVCATDGDCVSGVCTPTQVCGACATNDQCTSSSDGLSCLSDNSCGCASNTQCSAANPVCVPGANKCRQCVTNEECPASAPVCTPAGACAVCSGSNPGVCSGATPLCTLGAMPECAVCAVDAHCADSADGQACLLGAVPACGCRADSDCGPGALCNNATSACVAGCRMSADTCSAPLTCKSGNGDLGSCAPEASEALTKPPALAFYTQRCSSGDPSLVIFIELAYLARRRRR